LRHGSNESKKSTKFLYNLKRVWAVARRDKQANLKEAG